MTATGLTLLITALLYALLRRSPGTGGGRMAVGVGAARLGGGAAAQPQLEQALASPRRSASRYEATPTPPATPKTAGQAPTFLASGCAPANRRRTGTERRSGLPTGLDPPLPSGDGSRSREHSPT